jgi:hypothetical protein
MDIATGVSSSMLNQIVCEYSSPACSSNLIMNAATSVSSSMVDQVVDENISMSEHKHVHQI